MLKAMIIYLKMLFVSNYHILLIFNINYCSFTLIFFEVIIMNLKMVFLANYPILLILNANYYHFKLATLIVTIIILLLMNF